MQNALNDDNATLLMVIPPVCWAFPRGKNAPGLEVARLSNTDTDIGIQNTQEKYRQCQKGGITTYQMQVTKSII